MLLSTQRTPLALFELQSNTTMSRWLGFVFSTRWFFLCPEFCGWASLCLVGPRWERLVFQRLSTFHWRGQSNPDCLPLRPPHQLWHHLRLHGAGGRQQPDTEHPHRRSPHPLLPRHPCHSADALAPQVRFLKWSGNISFVAGAILAAAHGGWRRTIATGVCSLLRPVGWYWSGSLRCFMCSFNPHVMCFSRLHLGHARFLDSSLTSSIWLSLHGQVAESKGFSKYILNSYSRPWGVFLLPCSCHRLWYKQAVSYLALHGVCSCFQNIFSIGQHISTTGTSLYFEGWLCRALCNCHDNAYRRNRNYRRGLHISSRRRGGSFFVAFILSVL